MTVPDAPAEAAFAGFWPRVAASAIDCILIGIIVFPIVHAIYGPEYWSSTELIHGAMDFLLTWVLPAIAVIVFWIYKQATPGKMALGMRIVDAQTGGPPSTAQLIGRYFGYYVSLLGLALGFLWVAWDRRKQGWHDKLAGTVVVRRRKGPSVPAFEPSV